MKLSTKHGRVLPAAFLLIACSRRENESIRSDAETFPPPASDPRNVEAHDTATAIRVWWPLSCEAQQDLAWAACAEKPTGFERLRECAQAGLTAAAGAESRLPLSTAKSVCGREFEQRAATNVRAEARFFKDLLSWLEAHRMNLEERLDHKALTDVCRDEKATCANKPETWDDAYKGIHPGDVYSLKCLETMFQCDPHDSQCVMPKLAGRLGVACPGTIAESPPAPVFVRSTETPL